MVWLIVVPSAQFNTFPDDCVINFTEMTRNKSLTLVMKNFSFSKAIENMYTNALTEENRAVTSAGFKAFRARM